MIEIPGYTLLLKLGRGGMGEVYLAMQESLSREVALKLLAPELARDDAARDRFVREARIAANLHHPHIVPIHEVGVHEGIAYIAMEFEPDGTITELARQGVEPRLALRIVREIADALDYAHAQGVVHRDVKPDNILRRDNGLCLLSDFGIAHAVEVKTILSQEGVSAGTPQYMSPEQLRGQKVDGRSDLYSLGVVLYQLLAGRLPFEGADNWAVGTQHINDPVPRLPAASAHLQGLVDALMAKDREARPRSGAEVMSRIDALLAGHAPAETVPLAAAQKTATPRRATLVVGAAILAAALIAALVWQPWRAHPVAPATPAAATSATPEPAADRKSVAVLPFDNLSGRAEDAYLADGLQEEVLNALARLNRIKVISRTSVMEYRGKARNVREIGERLGAGTVLEGSIRREGNTLRLTVQLIDAHDDRHLLAANYDRDMTHLLELQSAVAREVAEAMSATLTRAERGEIERVGTNNGDAYGRYLRAAALFRRPVADDDFGVVEPIRLLEEALRFDPEYADALAMLAQARVWAYFTSHASKDSDAARQSFEHALAIEPELPEARMARGLYAMYVTENLDQAVDEFRAVVRLRPNASDAHKSLGFALRRGGRFVEALAEFNTALELDPVNDGAFAPVMTTLQGLRRYPEALELAQRYVRTFPNDVEGHLAAARIQGLQQRSGEPMRALLRDHDKLFDADTHKAIEAEIARAEGRYVDAIRLWDEVPARNPLARHIRVAFLCAVAGDAKRSEREFRAAERELSERLARGYDPDALRELAVVQSMLGEHVAALATVEDALAKDTEAGDAVNGPLVSFMRSVILVRAGRKDEGYAEAERLLRVPFGSPVTFFEDPDPLELLLKDDPRYDELIHHPPRL